MVDYDEVRRQLDIIGLTVSPHDVKNGNKGKVIDNVVPKTSKTEEAVVKLMRVFDGLDITRIFVPDEDASMEEIELPLA